MSTDPESLKKSIEETIKQHAIVIYTKATCPFCIKAKALLKLLGHEFHEIQIDTNPELFQALKTMTGKNTVPQVFVGGTFLGGNDDLTELNKKGLLETQLNKARADIQRKHSYDYDLIVIGGGSGGLSASKEAARLGQKVAVLDFVTPTPINTTWGLGGTCVNVGCIPKKLMHQASLLGEALHDSAAYGWKVEPKEKIPHDWAAMVAGIQDHIGGLNWGYRVSLRDSKVEYLNSWGSFVDAHTVHCVDKRKKEKTITADKILIATGLRPKYPENTPGAREYGITSDDLFSLSYAPGKTLLVGASYVALECAGFLKGIGYDVTVMVRSILLRGFDQEMAERIGKYMTEEGMKFIRPAIPIKVEQLEEGQPGKLKVTFRKYKADGSVEGEFSEEFNTVIWAMGRETVFDKLGLDKAGIRINPENKKIVANDEEQTSQSNIYAIGDVLDGRLELTPVAIQAGKLLARRLYAGSKTKMDYINVPTTVFTPLEYGACGLSEEDAIKRHGAENIEVYHSLFKPLEWTVPHRSDDACYLKLVCLKTENERVVGLHYLGPNAGEVTQGYAVAMKLGATKATFDDTVGIHPTNSEVFTVVESAKSSGRELTKSSC